MSDRIDRIESLLLEEISQALLRDMKDPRIGLVTVIDAKVSRDLSTAKVHVSILGDDDQRKTALDALQHSAGYVQCLLGKRLHLKRIPRLEFIEDASLRHVDRITRLLRGEGVEGEV